MNSIRQLNKKLGIGAHGVVYEGFDENRGFFVAIKEIPYLESAAGGSVCVSPFRGGGAGTHALGATTPSSSPHHGPREATAASTVGEDDGALAIMREIRFMERATHPNLVRYYGARRSALGVQLIMEYVGGGSLETLLKRCGRLRESVCKAYVRDVLEGLVYLHDTMHVCHRDIKPGNILLTPEGRCKLTDFGVSKALADCGSRGGIGGDAFMHTTVGTPWYMAPEVISGGVEEEASEDDDTMPYDPLRGITPRSQTLGYSTSADVWSLGVTLFEMISGQRPFGAGLKNPTAVLFSIINSAASPPELPAGYRGEVSPELHAFLELCFVFDKSLRPSARELLSHKWLAGGNGGGDSVGTGKSALTVAATAAAAAATSTQTPSRPTLKGAVAPQREPHELNSASHVLPNGCRTSQKLPQQQHGSTFQGVSLLDVLDLPHNVTATTLTSCSGNHTDTTHGSTSLSQLGGEVRRLSGSDLRTSNMSGSPMPEVRTPVYTTNTSASSSSLHSFSHHQYNGHNRRLSGSQPSDAAAMRYTQMRSYISQSSNARTTAAQQQQQQQQRHHVARNTTGSAPARPAPTGMWSSDGHYVDFPE